MIESSGRVITRTSTTVERVSDCELVVTRRFAAPPRIVFAAWSTPDLFRQWWVPQSFKLSIVSYEAEIRTGGTYRLVMRHPSFEQPMAFFGRYLEVTPHSRLVWTNDEEGEGGAVTTVVFEDECESTLVVVRDVYASKAALDVAIASGSTGGWGEQFAQLDAFIRNERR